MSSLSTGLESRHSDSTCWPGIRDAQIWSTMNQFTQLPKERWEEFFDDLSSILREGRQVDIEVAGLSIGDQIAAEHLPLNGLTYDPKDDTFYIYTNGQGNNLDHAISHPREIWIDFAGGVPSVVRV